MKKFTRYSSSEKVTLCKKEGNKSLRERFTFLELEILSFFSLSIVVSLLSQKMHHEKLD